jgi:predicted alpha/beta superfamily hydrolase
MVEFEVRVPEITPHWQPVFLAGDGPVFGDWAADAVRLDRFEDGTHHARLALPHEFRGRFLVTLGRWRDAESDGRGYELPARVLHVSGPVTVEAHVAGWGRTSIHYHHDFESQFLPHPRTISVWVPPGYDLDPHRRYPVLYMHDGQNLFDPETAFAGNPWWANEVAEREIRASRVRPLIIVGVANTADRLREYGPRRCGKERMGDWSRDYGRFLVEEVKPFVDASYRTLRDAENTGVGGSSMGGLISLHLAKWYPGVFGRCAAMSPSLWWDREYFLRNVHVSPEWLKTCRVWLDMGTREGATEAGMRAMVGRARRLADHFAHRGMREGEQCWFEEVEDGLHNEAAWGGRLDRVLRFLFPQESGR